MHHLDRAVCRAHRREQAENGFPLLRGCPNTFAISLVAYVDQLDEDQRRAFADQLSDFIDAEEPTAGMTVEQRSVLLRKLPLVEAFFGGHLTGNVKPRRPDVRFIPVKVLAGVFRDQQVGGFEGWARMAGLDDDARVPAEAHAASLHEIVPVAPRRLRRLIKAAMSETFSAREQRLSSEHTGIPLNDRGVTSSWTSCSPAVGEDPSTSSTTSSPPPWTTVGASPSSPTKHSGDARDAGTTSRRRMPSAALPTLCA